jgi:hypothetical protein
VRVTVSTLLVMSLPGMWMLVRVTVVVIMAVIALIVVAAPLPPRAPRGEQVPVRPRILVAVYTSTVGDA